MLRSSNANSVSIQRAQMRLYEIVAQGKQTKVA